MPSRLPTPAASARIGMVNFINTAPLYETWRRTVTRRDWQVIEGPPSLLNRLLSENELDLGLVSSQEYAANSEQYKILGNLSISATGPVGSVFLFSRVPPEALEGRLVLLSPHSQTSVSLVKIILEEFYRVTPRYRTGRISDCSGPDDFAAVLSIGDEALQLSCRRAYPVRLDLSEIWHRQTGLPFVFALWAVREDYCRRDPDNVVAIHQELLRCLEEGRNNLPEISTRVAPRIPMPVGACLEYLQAMEYDLDEAKQAGLTCFFETLIRRGEVSPRALPLKICG